MHIRKGMGRLTRHWMALAVVGTLVLQTAPHASAGTSDELNQLQQQLNQIQEQKDAATNEMARIEDEAQEAQLQLDLADQELSAINSQLTVLQTQLAVTNNELKQIEADLQAATKVYVQRKGALATRIRTIQEEGRVSYLGVLFGASSFSDFISRFDVLKLVIKQDSKLFAQIRKDKVALEEKQATAQDKKSHLITLEAQQKAQLAEAETKRSEREVASRSLDSRKRQLQAQLDAYDQEAAAVTDKVWLLQQAQNRAGGSFNPIRPVRNSTITDVFGPRMHPILGVWKQHNGTDFAVNYGTPILAIESGVVIVAGWNDAFGNLVVIDHGGGIASWYGHSSKLLVKEGDTVVQGQQIAEAGSTGWSTGPHCHLEIHVNGQPVDPMSYLN